MQIELDTIMELNEPEESIAIAQHEQLQISPPDEIKGINQFDLLIMSEAGKPIYCYSKREDAVTLMPLCCSLLNYAKKAQKETISSIKTSDNLIINFSIKSPVIIVLIHESNFDLDPVILIDQVEAQLISILTAKTLRSILKERPTYDLKKLIYGSEKLIDAIANIENRFSRLSWPQVQSFLPITLQPNNSSDTNTQSSLPNAPAKPHRILVPLVIMAPNARESLHNTLSTVISNSSKNVVFSLLFQLVKPDGPSLYDHYEQQNQGDKETDVDLDYSLTQQSTEQASNDKYGLKNSISFQLITICNHHNRHKLDVADIHIIYALLNGTRSQLEAVDFLWMPVCLPRFNEDAFMHTYMSFTNQKNFCLVIFSVDREEFSNCREAKTMIEQKIEKLLLEPTQRSKMFYQLSPLVHPVLLELQEKLTNCSLSENDLAEVQQQALIYNNKLELYHSRQLQFVWYQTNKQVLWWQRSSKCSISPIIYYVNRKMFESSLKTLWLKLTDNSSFLGWHAPTFQLYTQFDRTITTNEATEVIQRITNWIKKEEDNFNLKEYR